MLDFDAHGRFVVSRMLDKYLDVLFLENSSACSSFLITCFTLFETLESLHKFIQCTHRKMHPR
jgi:hypothetical protein